MAGIFGEFVCGLRCPGSKARKILEKFGENSEHFSEQNSGRKCENFGGFSFCTFSDPCTLDGSTKGCFVLRWELTQFPVWDQAKSLYQRQWLRLQSPAPHTEYKTPLIPKIHPKRNPESPPKTKTRKTKKRKIYEKKSFFFFVFRRGFRGVFWGAFGDQRGLYFVRGAGDRKPRPTN